MRGPLLSANRPVRFAERFLRPSVGGLLDLVFPRSCVSCDTAVERGSLYEFLCKPCSRLLRFACPPACGTCGYPFFGAVEGEVFCEHCAELTPRFGEGRTAVLLKGPARDLVHQLKYHYHVHYLADVRRIFAQSPGLSAYLGEAWLVPVPLHPRKERERGFNQSRLLARELAAVAPVAGIIEPLLRTSDTDSQTQFDRRTRQSNLKNAFATRSGWSLNKEERYVLVDDVFTTGATLNACAGALQKAGANRIDVVTFGHG